jgi:hypothetical protein
MVNRQSEKTIATIFRKVILLPALNPNLSPELQDRSPAEYELGLQTRLLHLHCAKFPALEYAALFRAFFFARFAANGAPSARMLK